MYRILLIEDEEFFCDIVASMLEIAGYGVIVTHDGTAGLEAAKAQRPDIILCDVSMPGISGHDVLRELKSEPKLAGIPFIFLTGNAERKDVREGMQLGADDYLTKPFSEKELTNAIEACLAKKHALGRYFESRFDDVKMTVVKSLPHEFRTPMASILGFSEMLMEDSGIEPEQVREIGGLINKSGRRLHRLLENIELMGQIGLWENDPAMKAELQAAPSSNVLDPLRTAAERLMTDHERPGAIRISGNDLSVKMSSVHLARMLEEVLDNAMKFSAAEASVHVSIDEGETEGLIIVRDEGRGMTTEQLSLVSAFRQFNRAQFEQQGLGLGLVLASSLAKVYDGRLDITSEEGRGTTVSITLPKVLHAKLP